MLSGSLYSSEKNLIRVGNILLVLGAPIVVGPARASRYVLAPGEAAGDAGLRVRFFLILSGRPLLGICVEAFEFLNLFGNLFPMLGVMLGHCPFVPGVAIRAGIREGRPGTGACPCRRRVDNDYKYSQLTMVMAVSVALEGDEWYSVSVMEARARCSRRSMTPSLN